MEVRPAEGRGGRPKMRFVVNRKGETLVDLLTYARAVGKLQIDRNVANNVTAKCAVLEINFLLHK